MLNQRNLFILLIAIFLIAWLSIQLPSSTKPILNTDNLNEDTIKWQLEKVQLWSLENQPSPQHLYLKAKASHFNESQDTVIFEQPHAYFQTPENHLRLSSQQAIILNNQQITLQGKAHINNLSQTQQDQNNQLQSEKITYNKQTKQLTTSEKVHYQQQHLNLEATGLKANLETGHYQFLSNVKTQYDTQP